MNVGFVLRHQSEQALEHLQDAHTLLPKNPILALFISNIQAHTTDLESAIAMLEIYIQSYPADLPKQQELARLQTQHEIQGRYQSVEYQGLSLLYPPETSQLDWEPFLVWMDEQLEAQMEGASKR